MPHQQKMLGFFPGIGPHMLESQNRPVGAWPGLQSHWPNSFSSCSSLTPPSSLHITPIVIIITANIIITIITNIKLFTTIIHINTLSTVITISSISISMNILIKIRKYHRLSSSKNHHHKSTSSAASSTLPNAQRAVNECDNELRMRKAEGLRWRWRGWYWWLWMMMMTMMMIRMAAESSNHGDFWEFFLVVIYFLVVQGLVPMVFFDSNKTNK